MIPDSAGRQGLILRQGEEVGYTASHGLLGRKASHPASVAAWRRSELMIDRQPIGQVVREIARYRTGPTLIWADLSDDTLVNGAFRVDDANGALHELAAVNGLTITWTPGNIAIIRSMRTAS